MQEPIDSSGELMKDRRYGTGLREDAELQGLKRNRKYLKGFLAKDREARDSLPAPMPKRLSGTSTRYWQRGTDMATTLCRCTECGFGFEMDSENAMRLNARWNCWSSAIWRISATN